MYATFSVNQLLY